MATMKAIVVKEPGDASVLKLGEAPRPSLKPNDVRVKVAATAVNRADVMQRQGKYPPPPGASEIIGLECSGTITELGPEVKGWREGQRVMGLLSGGAYAEEVAIDAGSILEIPDGISDLEAAAIPETYLTAYLNIFMIGGAKKGDTVLVHGGGSGIGTSAIALCNKAGVKVIVTAGSEDKCEQCRKHGADVAINYRTESFVERVKEETGGAGVNMLLDVVGGPYLQDNLQCVAMDGKIVIIGWLGGTKVENVDLQPLLMRRISLIGSTLRSRSNGFKADLVSQFAAFCKQHGQVKPAIYKVLPLAEAAAAHSCMESSEHFGKIVLKVAAE